MFIDREGGIYRLWSYDDYHEGHLLVEGPAIEDVTQRWMWVLDEQQSENVVAFPVSHADAGRLAPGAVLTFC